ncbi:beta strand repeat-containing protein, partial [Cylindrospermopsis raciborskii]|uniref:beta strand repeat-containing protein n=1 Tax=Cylindrospermopsis raciborskii TaxID=77022 RepID=UPI000AB6C7A2
VLDVSYGSIGQVSVFHYNDVDTNYGPAYSVWAEGYSGLGSESGYAYDYQYSSPDNYFSNYYEADLGNSSRVDLYYFTYYYNDNPATTNVIEGDYYQGYGYAVAGTYTQGQRIDQTLTNETGGTGYYKITSVYSDSNYSSANTVYVYNYYDGDTSYGWAWSTWGQGSAGLGSEYGYAYDYNYITTDPFFGNSGSTIYEADLLSNYGRDTNPTLATATNLGVIDQRTLSSLTVPDTSSFSVGTDPGSNNLVPADVDMYRFELNQSGTISLETSRPQNGVEMDTILRLFDVYGNNLGTDDDTGPDFYSRLNAYLEVGTYYFGVSGYANFSYSPTSANSGVEGSNGDYAIKVAFDPATTAFVGDPNGTATGARDIGALNNFATFGGADVPSIIGLDTNQQGVDPTPENLIAVGDKDVDLIKFTVNPGLVIFQTSDYVPDYINKFGQARGQAYLDLLDSNRDGSFDDSIDTVLRLFDFSGNQLAIDDDGGEGLLSRLEYVFTTAGTYYLGISGHGNSTYNINTSPENVDTDSSRRSGSTGSSLLSIILQPDSAPQDPNGVFYGAIPIDLLYGSNLTLSERIGTDILADENIDVISGDVDLYRFTANESGVILIDLDTIANTGLNTYLRVFDDNGITLAGLANDDAIARDFNGNLVTETGTNSTDSFVRLDVTAGNTYYIGVSASGNQTYNLTDLTNRTSPSTGDYQINLQYGGGATDEDGYINANLPRFNLTQTNTGNLNVTSLQRNIGNDAQVQVGATDVDFVRVYFESANATPRILTATAQGNPGATQNSLVPTVYVFDGTGNRLSAATSAPTSSSRANAVQLSLNPNTDYYVAVASYGNENFNPLIMGSGIAADTGNYTLDLSLSGTGSDRQLLTGILNAANLRGSLYGNSLDFDIDLFGTGTPRSYTLSSTSSQRIVASLGEDVDQSSPTGEETNAFGQLYIAAQGLTGTAANITANSSDVGADDVDIYPINITEAGIYRFTTSGTGIAIDDARPTLKIFDAQGAAVSLTDYGAQGLVTGNVLADLAIGDYYFVVMSTGTGTDQFVFGSDPRFGTALTEAQLREFYQNTGNYQLDMSKATLGQPNTWVDRGTSFAQRFSLPLDVASLQLYGASGISPSLSVTGPSGSVAGSLVYDEDNNTLRFVPTNPILAVGDYTITYSDPSDFRADGANVTAGNLQSATFNVPAAGPVVYLPSFARGPGQPVNINGTGIPVKISNTDGLTNIRITVDYDSDALNITGAQLASGLTGWEIVGTPTIANGRVTVDLRDIITDNVNNPLPAGDREVIRLIADVPNNAVFNSAEVIEVSAGARAGSRSVAISDSTSVQKVAFFADTNANGRVNAADAVSILRLAAGLANGFSSLDLVDPNIVADINGNNRTNAADAVSILRFAAGLPSNNIPVVPNPSLATSGIDPTISILPANVTGARGDTVSLKLSITSTEQGANNLAGYGLRVRFDTNLLDIADGQGDSADVTPSSTAGFTVVENVSDANGSVILVGARATGLNITSGFPIELATLNFRIKNGASIGTTTLTLDLAPNNDLTDELDNTLVLTAQNSTITITTSGDTTTPVIPANQTFSYSEGKTVNFQVGTVTATDAVGVTNFAIASGNGSGFFAINNSGVITLTTAGAAATAASNDFETTPNTFTLGITASDAANNISAPVDININVTNSTVDDSLLVVTHQLRADQPAIDLNYRLDNFTGDVSSAVIGIYFSNELQIDVNAITIGNNTGTIPPAGRTATTTDSNNADSDNSTQNFVLLTFQPLTTSSTESLLLTIPFVPTDQFDGEAKVNFIVSTTNPNLNIASIASAIIVDGFDVTTPTDSNIAANTVAENGTNGTLVGITASATDADNSNNTVTYNLTDNAGGRFAINSTTGVVSVADASLLNFETAQSHNITVRASSTDGSTSDQTFTLTVTDVNEAPTAVTLTNTTTTSGDTTTPVIPANQTFSYSEGKTVNFQVGTVTATDAVGVTN